MLDSGSLLIQGHGTLQIALLGEDIADILDIDCLRTFVAYLAGQNECVFEFRERGSQFSLFVKDVASVGRDYLHSCLSSISR